MYHFQANIVSYRNGVLVRLIYNSRRMNAKLLSEIQQYKYSNNLDFEVLEVNRKRIIKYD